MLKGGMMPMLASEANLNGGDLTSGWLLLLLVLLWLPSEASRAWALLWGRLEMPRGGAPISDMAGGG